jgi:hypothetical protein
LPGWSEFAPVLTPLRLELLADDAVADGGVEPVAMRD